MSTTKSATAKSARRTLQSKSRDLPDGPWMNVQIDFLLIPILNKELLMMIDTYSRMTWVIEVKSTDTESTIIAMNSVFAIWVFPDVIQSDNGPPFMSPKFSEH